MPPGPNTVSEDQIDNPIRSILI